MALEPPGGLSRFNPPVLHERRSYSWHQPKLQPNAIARLVRWSYRNPGRVGAGWLAVLVAGLVAAILLFKAPAADAPPGLFPGQVDPAESLPFARLGNLGSLTLTGSDPAKVSASRDAALQTLEQSGAFDVVFSPGAGDFYDANAMLYRPKDEVNARVAYALSLSPLFNAVAAAPDSSSMATLTGAIAGSVSQGRNPEGLDDMLNEAASSVQSLMKGEDQPVDWAKIAGLSLDPHGRSVVLMLLPKPGAERQASDLARQVADALPIDAGVKAELKMNASAPDKAPASRDGGQLIIVGALAMGAFLAALVIAVLFGRILFAAMVFSPGVVIAPAALAAFSYFAGSQWLTYWALIAMPVFAAGTAALQLLLGAAEQETDRVETALMLSAQANGWRAFWTATAAMSPCVPLMLWPADWAIPAASLTIAFVILALGAAMTLPAAICSRFPQALVWQAGFWLRPAHRALFESARWAWAAPGIGTLAVAAAGLWLINAPQQVNPEPVSGDQPVALVARDEAQALDLIARLKDIPSAESVQWLGSFVPDDSQEKVMALRQLRGRFPRITPVEGQAAIDVRDDIDTMQDNLKDIAESGAARDGLKAAADAFRRSLAVLAATSRDDEVLKLENRLFGAFNRLSDQAENLAKLKPLTLEDLPPPLHVLFGAPPGPFRLVVTPQAGIDPVRFAATLQSQGLPVHFPALAQLGLQDDARATLYRMLALWGLLSVLVLFLAAGSVAEAVVSTAVLAGTAVVVAAIFRYAVAEADASTLMSACLCLGAASACGVLRSSGKALGAGEMTGLVFLPTFSLAMAAPAAMLGLSSSAFATAVALLAAACVTGLFNRRGAPELEL